MKLKKNLHSHELTRPSLAEKRIRNISESNESRYIISFSTFIQFVLISGKRFYLLVFVWQKFTQWRTTVCDKRFPITNNEQIRWLRIGQGLHNGAESLNGSFKENFSSSLFYNVQTNWNVFVIFTLIPQSRSRWGDETKHKWPHFVNKHVDLIKVVKHSFHFVYCLYRLVDSLSHHRASSRSFFGFSL